MSHRIEFTYDREESTLTLEIDFEVTPGYRGDMINPPDNGEIDVTDVRCTWVEDRWGDQKILRCVSGEESIVIGQWFREEMNRYPSVFNDVCEAIGELVDV